MCIRAYVVTFLFLIFHPHASFAEDGVPRSLPVLISDATSIRSVTIDKLESAGCVSSDGTALTKYTGKVKVTYKGKATDKDSFIFCGYPGLINYGLYVIAFNEETRDGLPVFMPDAIFSEHFPGEYYRLLSYHSREFKVDGKKAIVLAFEQKDLLEALESKP